MWPLTHHSRQRGPHGHPGPHSRGQSADEASWPVHRHRQIRAELHHRVQSQRERDLGHRHSLPGHAARPHGPSKNARLNFRLCWSTRQIQIPQLPSRCERQSRRNRRAHGMGSNSGFAPTRWHHKVDRMERSARYRKTSRFFAQGIRLDQCASHQEQRLKGRCCLRACFRQKETYRHLPVSFHEARAHWPNHGRCGCEARWNGSHSYAQSEPSGASR